MDTEKKSSVVRIVLRCVILAIIAFLVVFIVANYKNIRMDRIAGFVMKLTGKEANATAALSFSPDATNTFEPYGSGLAVMSSAGLTAIDAAGNEKLSQPFTMSRPVLKSQGEYMIAYDTGGKQLIYAQDYTIKMNRTYPSTILTCSINPSGWFVVAAEENGSKATASVYNADMTEVYKWYSSERYITCAALADDDARMAIGGLRQEKARIMSSVVLLRFNSEEPYAQVDVPDVLILDIKFLSDGSLAVVTEDSIIVLDKDGKERGRYTFDSKLIKEYSLDGDGFMLLRLSNSGVGESSNLIVLNFDAKAIKQTSMNNILSTDCQGKFVGVLTSDHIIVYNSSLEEQFSSSINAGSKKLLMRTDGAALVLSSEKALIYR